MERATVDVQLDALIQKINEDGVGEAKKQAEQIIADAEAIARKTILDADAKAKQKLSDAEAAAAQLETRSNQALQQAGRDLILSLTGELQAILGRLIRQDLTAALTPAQVGTMLETCVKTWTQSGGGEFQVLVGEQDAEALAKHFGDRLTKELENCTIQPHRQVTSGFRISRGEGSVQWDFTGAGLSDIVAAFLNSKLAELIREK